jgi:transposase
VFNVGFDLGKRKSSICIQTVGGKIVLEVSIKTTREEIKAVLERYVAQGQVRVLIESSTSSEWIARYLESIGCAVIVGDPRFAAMYAQRSKKVKNDRLDARALATALRLEAYRPAHRRSDEARRLHAQLAIRKTLIRTRTQLINLVRSIGESEGVIFSSCAVEWFNETVFSEAGDELLQLVVPALLQISELDHQIADYDKMFEELAETNDVAKVLVTAPGVGPVAAATFISVVDDVKRFESARELTAYLGLVPSENNTGGSKRPPGAITKAGSPLMRTQLYQSAFCITSGRARTSHLKRFHEAVAKRGHKRKATIAVARRLARILFAMWRDMKPYDESLTAPATASKPAEARAA